MYYITPPPPPDYQLVVALLDNRCQQEVIFCSGHINVPVTVQNMHAFGDKQMPAGRK